MKFDNVISFSNGNAILMLSQDRIGSARGANVDYEILDEAFESVFGRLPETDDDAFAALKNHFQNN